MTLPPTQTPEDNDATRVSSTQSLSKPNASHPQGAAECSSPTSPRDRTGDPRTNPEGDSNQTTRQVYSAISLPSGISV